jgi:hypothetical protein
MNWAILRIGAVAGAIAVAPVRVGATPATASRAVIETYTVARPWEAGDILRPMYEVFAEHGFITGPALSEALAVVSRAGVTVPEQQLQYLVTLVDNGWTLLRRGKYLVDDAEPNNERPGAVPLLARAVTLIRGAPAVLARDSALGTTAQKAMIGVALARLRHAEKTKDKDLLRASEDDLAEALRSFPTLNPDPGYYGSDVVRWWARARSRLTSKGTGTLIVDPGDDGVAIFRNESYVGTGTCTSTGLPPGVYRIYAQKANASGRVYSVEVRPGEVTRRTIDWEFDSRLRTGAYVGFVYQTAAEHRERRVDHGARIAQAKGVAETIVIGLASRESVPYVFGLLVDQAGRVLISGEVLLARSEPETERDLRAFAKLLAGEHNGKRPLLGVQPLDLESDPLPWSGRPALAVDAERPTVEARGTSLAGPVLASAGVGVSIAALGAGIFWSTVDDDCIAAGGDGCGAIRTTKAEAITAASAGVALSALTGYVWGRRRPAERRLLRGEWVWVAGGLSVAMVATGTGLMTIDERAHQLGDGDANVGLRPYRPTLQTGAIVTAAGAAGLGFSIYSAMGTDDGAMLMPTLGATGDGAAFGIAGRF